jgi:hypothetical protein
MNAPAERISVSRCAVEPLCSNTFTTGALIANSVDATATIA